MSRLLATACVLFLLHASAFAQAMPDPRVESLLQKLQAATSPPIGPAAVVDRSARVRVRVTIQLVGSPRPNHAVYCEASLFHFTAAGLSYQEAKATLIALANTMVCDITIPFHWTEADDTRAVSVQVVLRPPHTESEFARKRLSVRSYAIPLPANGATALVTDDIDW